MKNNFEKLVGKNDNNMINLHIRGYESSDITDEKKREIYKYYLEKEFPEFAEEIYNSTEASFLEKTGGPTMSLQEEIKKINEKIEALNKDMQSLMSELDAEQENDFPQDGEEYWYIDDDAEVMNIEWYDSEYSRGRVSIGNIFHNEEEAELAVGKLKVETELRKFSRPFKRDEKNYYLEFCPSDKAVTTYCCQLYQTQGVIYFESSEKVKQAIEAVGEERIKKYIFGEEG